MPLVFVLTCLFIFILLFMYKTLVILNVYNSNIWHHNENVLPRTSFLTPSFNQICYGLLFLRSHFQKEPTKHNFLNRKVS